MKLFISAGDPSGDIRMAEVLTELCRITDVQSHGLGGDDLSRAGMNVDFHLSDYSVMGFLEVLSSLPKLRTLRKRIKSRILEMSSDAIILVDYPGFNLPLAKWASSKGFRVIYFISPQVWAWGKGRIKKIRKYVDLMIPLFEFEEKFYLENGVRAVWGGHPIVDSIPEFSDGEKEYMALLPGSREQELHKMLPAMAFASHLLHKQGVISKVVIATAKELPIDLTVELPEDDDFTLITRPMHEALAMSRAAVVCSGTATLETALFGVPFIIVYKTSNLTWFLAKLFVRGLTRIGMVNIITGRNIAQELLQSEVFPERIAQAVRPLIEDTAERITAVNNLQLVEDALGPPGASKRIAEIIIGEIDIET